MKKIGKNYKWYIFVALVVLFAFSAICWLNLAKELGSAAINRIESSSSVKEDSDTVEVITENAEEISNDENIDSSDTDYFALFDKGIDKIDSHWSNAMFKKSYLGTVDSKLTYFSTKQILSAQVIKGKNNWLFYKSTTDANSIADYEGTNRYSDDEKKAMLEEAIKAQKEIEDRGIKFAIFIAPNKENVYAEYMPDTYQHAKISSTDILIDYLENGGVNVVSPKKSMLDNHMDMQLYYSYDTHWNQLGGYIGVKEILDLWGVELPPLSERSIISSNLRDNYHSGGEDDLAKMIGLLSVFDDEIEYEVEGTGIVDWESYADEQDKEQISHYINDNALVSDSVLLVGDSFRTSMIPALMEAYRNVYVVHRSFYSSKMLDEIKPTHLIIEYVERYSSGIGGIYSLINE